MFSIVDMEHYLPCEFQFTTHCISADLFKYCDIKVANKLSAPMLFISVQ